MDVRHVFEGKKITVMGLGLLGRGVGDARFLAKQGAILTITDLKTKEELATSLAELTEFPNITYVLGEHRLDDFRDRDFILKAAGVPLDSVYIAEAEKAGIPVKMSASWFMELANIPVVGVTGTRGKSTVTHMLHNIMRSAEIPVVLGGNVRGVSTLALLDTVTPDHHALFELDSWQCQGFGDAKLSPQLSVFTTFMPDHMNYYRDDMDAYLADKANIFLYQTPEDTLILGAQCAELVEESYSERIQAHVVVTSGHDFREDWELRIPGEHNRYDAALAVEAARALYIDEEIIKEALELFTGVPGRLQLIRTKGGVDFYNDSNATTPDATIAALEAFPEGSIVLIMGGADKGLAMETLMERVRSRTKFVVLLAGTGTERVKDYLPEATVCDTLAQAVEIAVSQASEGDTVVLSPAFASFGMFKNEYDRGDQFDTLIKNL